MKNYNKEDIEKAYDILSEKTGDYIDNDKWQRAKEDIYDYGDKWGKGWNFPSLPPPKPKYPDKDEYNPPYNPEPDTDRVREEMRELEEREKALKAKERKLKKEQEEFKKEQEKMEEERKKIAEDKATIEKERAELEERRKKVEEAEFKKSELGELLT